MSQWLQVSMGAFGGFSVIVIVITFLLVMSSHLITLVKYPWGRSLRVFSECLYLYFCDNFYEQTEERGRVGVEGESDVDFMGSVLQMSFFVVGQVMFPHHSDQMSQSL